MLSSIWRWLNDRWPLSALLCSGLEETIPGGSSFAYTLGSATLIVFLLQVVTGVWQLFYYVPTVDHAYDSLNYLRDDVPFGWLIHGLHYWGASAMVVLVGLHMVRVFLWGAYKRPRELTWLLGVVLLILTAGMSFSGAPLPWDERGYWAAEVGASIAGTVPVIGGLTKHLLLGGDAMGQLTLSRFFILHVAILPGILFALIGAHLVAFRRFGSAGSWNEAKHKRRGQFWPDQVFKDVLVGTVLFLILIILSAYAPPALTGPADPVDTSYFPKPEWNFLFLYQALKSFPGRLESIGTVGIPTVIIVLLVALPFLDRHKERNPARRPFIMACGLLWVVGVLAFTVVGYYSTPGGARTAAISPPVASVATLSASARQGAALFRSLGCLGCHRLKGTGGTLGPDLTNEAVRKRSRKWLIAQVQNPKTHDPKALMPSFSMLSDQQLSELVDYLQSLGAPGAPPPEATRVTNTLSPAATGGVAEGTPTPAVSPSSVAKSSSSTPPTTLGEGPPGPAAAILGNAGLGAVLFQRDCASCHGPQGVGHVANPGANNGAVPSLNPLGRQWFSTDPQVFADNIDRIIQHGSIPSGPKPTLKMPAFGDSHTLTQQEIANIEAYVLRLNGVDRAQLHHPGIAPHRFVQLTLAAFALAGLGLGVVWARKRTKVGRHFS